MNNKQIVTLSNYLNGQANLPIDVQVIADNLKELLIQIPEVSAEVLVNEQTEVNNEESNG